MLNTGLWLAGNEGMGKKMETPTMGYIGTTIRIHSFIPSYNNQRPENECDKIIRPC